MFTPYSEIIIIIIITVLWTAIADLRPVNGSY